MEWEWCHPSNLTGWTLWHLSTTVWGWHLRWKEVDFWFEAFSLVRLNAMVTYEFGWCQIIVWLDNLQMIQRQSLTFAHLVKTSQGGKFLRRTHQYISRSLKLPIDLTSFDPHLSIAADVLLPYPSCLVTVCASPRPCDSFRRRWNLPKIAHWPLTNLPRGYHTLTPGLPQTDNSPPNKHKYPHACI